MSKAKPQSPARSRKTRVKLPTTISPAVILGYQLRRDFIDAVPKSKREQKHSKVLALIAAERAATPGISDREAILRHVPVEELRNFQDILKVQRNEDLVRRRDVVQSMHEDAYPAFCPETRSGPAFGLVTPGNCEGLPQLTGVPGRRVLVGVRAELHGKKSLTAFLVEGDKDTVFDASMLEGDGDPDAIPICLRVLGLDWVQDAGVLHPTQDIPPAARALGEALKGAWTSAKCPTEEDDVVALIVEYQRIKEIGLDEIEASLSPGFARTLAVYGDAPILRNASHAKISLLSKTASFADPALLSISEATAGAFEARPTHFFTKHISEWLTPAIDLGRKLGPQDAEWLLSTFGELNVAPISPRTIEVLLRWRGAIDLYRLRAGADAAGLIVLIESALEWDPLRTNKVLVDDLLGLLFARLATDGRPYAECSADLAEVARALRVKLPSAYESDTEPRTPLASVIAAVTSGAEAACRRIASKAALPTLARLWRAERDCDPLNLDTASLLEKVETAIRSMMPCRLGDLARLLATSFDCRNADFDPFSIRQIQVREATESEIDKGWSEVADLIPIAMMAAPRESFEDQFRTLVLAAPDVEPDAQAQPVSAPAADAVRSGMGWLKRNFAPGPAEQRGSQADTPAA